VPLLSSRALGAGVEVAEGAAAHGGRLAMESAGHTGTTFGDHEVFSCGCPPLGVWGKLCVFNGLAEAPVVSTFFSGTWKPNF
jgi:hypothetical protein